MSTGEWLVVLRVTLDTDAYAGPRWTDALGLPPVERWGELMDAAGSHVTVELEERVR
jgi:hypothetical protein